MPSEGTVEKGQHEVVIPININLPETVQVDMDPLVIRLPIPVAWFKDEVKQG